MSEEKVTERFIELLYENFEDEVARSLYGKEQQIIKLVRQAEMEVYPQEEAQAETKPGCLARVKNVVGVGLLILLAAFLVMLFIPNSDPEPAAVDVQPTNTAIATVAEPTATTLPTDTPEPSRTPESDNRERAYVGMVQQTGQSIGDSMSRIGDLLHRASQNESLLYDGDFRIELAGEIANVQIQSEKILEWRPVPERLTEFHSGYEEVARLLLEAMDEIVYGVDNLDADAFNRATEIIEESTEVLEGLPFEDLQGD